MVAKKDMTEIIKKAEEVCFEIRKNKKCIPVEILLKEKELMAELIDPKLDLKVNVDKLSDSEKVGLLYLMCIATNYHGKIYIRLNKELKLTPYYQEVYKGLFEEEYSMMGDFYNAVLKENQLNI